MCVAKQVFDIQPFLHNIGFDWAFKIPEHAMTACACFDCSFFRLSLCEVHQGLKIDKVIDVLKWYDAIILKQVLFLLWEHVKSCLLI